MKKGETEKKKIRNGKKRDDSRGETKRKGEQGKKLSERKIREL